MYDSLKNQAPQIKTCVAGWGLAASFIESLPADVIAAPISHYSSGWTQGSTYGTREFWACPWLEKDFDSSGHYYPYNMHLSDTISSWQNRASNLKGLYCLSWRITDGVDAKMSYVAKVPWDTTNQLNTSQAAYHEYSVQNYGSAAADDITAIINQNEPIALYDGECRPTPALAGHLESYQVGQSEKAQQQLGTIDTWISTVSDKGSRRRLELLRCRIEAVKDFLDIYVNFPSINSTEQLPGSFASWAKNFSNRVTDISSLGNIQSIQNRYVQLRYIGKETQLIASQSVKAPSSVMAPPAGHGLGW